MDNAITRPRLLLGAAALLCLLVVQIAAASGSGDPQATASAGVSKKKFKKLKKQVNELQAQVDEVSKQPGPQGEQGPAGDDATKLFGYIREGFQGNPANVQYGSGVTAVSDPAPNGAYTVTFNRSLVNCVVQAVAGSGDPVGNGSPFVVPSSAEVSMSSGDPRQVEVEFRRLVAIPPDFPTGSPADTSFMITAFC